ncbi:MAG: hypothetical protein BACD_00124 [Bacteroides rodentium]
MKVTKLDSQTPEITGRKRVAAYARVSMDTERLQHSLSAQVSYYNDLIQKNPEWEFAGVFADYAVTGTKTEGRSEYQRLLDECEAGNVQIILVKSISRFARNTVDLLNTVRHLKEIGVEVRFEKENISSFSEDGELMLTLLASFAQEESRSISENCKWGIRKRYANGTIGLKNRRLYGYEHDGEDWRIIEDEAEIVRFMYSSLIDGMKLAGIVGAVKAKGAKTIQGKDFGYQQIEKILTNEFYCGDRKLQKTFIEDPISKKKVKNKGQLPQYYYRDDHIAVIDQEIFEKAQEVLAENKRYRREKLTPKYPFSSKITCSACGNHYTRGRDTKRKDGSMTPYWYCSKGKMTGERCGIAGCWKEEELEKASAEIMGTEGFDAAAFAGQIKGITTFPDGILEFDFYGGKKRTWKRPPKEAKTKKPTSKGLRPKQFLDGYIFCGKCGRRFGRVVQHTRSGDYNMWSCRSKRGKNITCGNVNYTEQEIKNAFCMAYGVEEFDEELFKETVEGIEIQDGGDIDIHLLDGTIRRIKNLKFLPGKHTFSFSEEFTGKIRCRCGCEYLFTKNRNRYGKYGYWRCPGKGRDYMECTAQDYPDYQIRKVAAYLMGTDDFDEDKFEEQVERITAVDNGLVFTFKDGRNKTWHRML